jgi:hypothetical protein
VKEKESEKEEVRELELAQAAEEEREKEREGMARGGQEKEKESAKEKIGEIQTVPNDSSDSTSSRAPTRHINTPAASPPCPPTPTSSKPTATSFTGDVALQRSKERNRGSTRGQEPRRKKIRKEVRTTNNTTGDNTTCLAPSLFDWAEDVDATVSPNPIALVAPAARTPRNFSSLRSSTRNPWGSLSRRHRRSQPCTRNSFYSCKYNTNYPYAQTLLHHHHQHRRCHQHQFNSSDTLMDSRQQSPSSGPIK